MSVRRITAFECGGNSTFPGSASRPLLQPGTDMNLNRNDLSLIYTNVPII